MKKKLTELKFNKKGELVRISDNKRVFASPIDEPRIFTKYDKDNIKTLNNIIEDGLKSIEFSNKIDSYVIGEIYSEPRLYEFSSSIRKIEYLRHIAVQFYKIAE